MEILTTLALRERMHVVDRHAPAAGEHVVTEGPHLIGAGQYALGLDGVPAIVGARHSWLDVTA
jgi:hypothetical protein